MIFATQSYKDFCEAQLKQQREDFLQRLAEKDTTIRQLRVEVADLRAKQLPVGEAFMPDGRFADNPEGQKAKQIESPQGWDSELKRMLQEEEDGIRNSGRLQEHEPSADDGA